MWEHKLNDPKSSEKDKALAKEFLDSDIVQGKYQDGFPGIIGIIIKKDNKTLILYHNKTGEYSIPTGKVEYREKDEEAVIREAEEETGLIITKCSYKGFVKFKRKKDDKDIIIRVYKADDYNGTATNKEPDKHYSLRWLSKQEINNLIRLDQAGDTIILSKKNSWL